MPDNASQPDGPHFEDLSARGDWDKILAKTEAAPRSPEASYYRGLALARIGKLQEAEQAFQEGLPGEGPWQGRFLVELAGIRFKQKQYPAARVFLHRAMVSGMTDPYVFDFLGTLYFLEGRLEAALKYWNRIGKPRVEQIRVEPPGVIDPILLDRGLAISRASVLELSSLNETRARLENLRIFAMQRYQLNPRADTGFDLTVRLLQAPGLSRGRRLTNLVSLTRELPFQTIHADFTNIGASARNGSIMLRWNPGDQRFAAGFSSPLARQPRTVLALHLDSVREDWDLGSRARETSSEWVSVRSGATLHHVANNRWSWSTGMQLGHQRLRLADSTAAPPTFPPGSGFLVQSVWQTRLGLVQVPERRLDITSNASWDIGRDLRNRDSLFSRLQSGIDLTWQPQDQLQVATSLQAGKAGGTLPLDQLFRMGLERDPGLLLRGHSGISGGVKGRGPIGTGYLLANFDLSRRLFTTGFFSVAAGPFLDSARVFAPLSATHEKWLWDTGVETRLSVLGMVHVAFSYGFDTRSGETLFFARLLR